MNIERNGGVPEGDASDAQLEERLARHFDAELAQAQRDYGRLSIAKVESERLSGAGSVGRMPRLAGAVAAVGILAVVGLVGIGLGSRPTTPNPIPGPVAASVPVQIDGQRVWALSEQSQWPSTSASFLLRAYAVEHAGPCLQPIVVLAQAEQDVFPDCLSVALVPHSGPNTSFFNSLAPRTIDLLTPWLGGSEIVIRVHSHDTEAEQCESLTRAGCDAALVIESVVWSPPVSSASGASAAPATIPTEIDGQKIYRAADAASFPAGGSFLLGGAFSKPEVVPPCPAPIDKTPVEQQLIPYCYIVSIDGLNLAPKSNIAEPRGELVVARVHIDDAQAAQCPAKTQAECKASIVVESVIWSAAGSTSPTASPAGALPSIGIDTGTGNAADTPPVPPVVPAGS